MRPNWLYLHVALSVVAWRRNLQQDDLRAVRMGLGGWRPREAGPRARQTYPYGDIEAELG